MINEKFTLNDSSLTSKAIAKTFNVSDFVVWNWKTGRTRIPEDVIKALILVERRIKKLSKNYY